MASIEPYSDALLAKLEALPPRPGCYLFRGKDGELLYVGKAKSLRSRVRSYFQETTDDRAFIPFLRRSALDIETIVTASEKEAAILENNLIKEQRPKYNIKLRDDKEYLSIRLSAEHAFPRLELVRKPKPDRARYFGPYPSATAARRTLHLVEKHFKLRTCTDREFEGRKRPCLKYQIGRCPAPCVLEVDKDLYMSQVRVVSLFLDGRHNELSKELKARMQKASAAFEFELAAMYRDQMSAVEAVRESQRVVSVSDADQDVLGIYREGDLVELSLMFVRSGRVVEVVSFSSRNVELPEDEIVAAFLRETYGIDGSSEGQIPDEIIVPVLPEGSEGVTEWLSERRVQAQGRKSCEIWAPVRGPRRALLDMAIDNARHAFEEKRRAKEDIEERLARIKQRLRLATLPRRIECCDISHLGGQDTVGAVVALENGALDKKRYRTYHVKGAGPGDDYKAMYEVLSRRFRRGKNAQLAMAADDAPLELADLDAELDLSESVENAASDVTSMLESAETPESERAEAEELLRVAEPVVSGTPSAAQHAEKNPEAWSLPDLFVVDGGRGQLQVALTAARDLGITELAIVGLAKEKENVAGEKLVDRVYLPGQKNPIALRPNSPELFLLAKARDEAHRFSNRGRKKIGAKRRFRSVLEDLKGIGPRTRKALLKALGSLDGIRDASDEQVLAVSGVNRKHLAILRAGLVSTPPNNAITGLALGQDSGSANAGAPRADGTSPNDAPARDVALSDGLALPSDALSDDVALPSDVALSSAIAALVPVSNEAAPVLLTDAREAGQAKPD